MLTVEQQLLRPGVSETFPYATRFSKGDLPLAYFDAGQGDAVVLLHGLGGNFTHFEHVAPSLARHSRVIGVDMPGCGDSAKPDIRYSIELFASSTVRLLDELRIERAVFVGHSLGGMVAGMAALHRPDRVAGMVLINSAGFHRYTRPIRLAGRALLRESVLVPAMKVYAAKLLDRHVFAVKNRYTARFIAQTEGRPASPTVDDFGRVTQSLAPQLVDIHFLDKLDRFVQPTLVLWGARDQLLPPTDLSRWVSRLPDGQLLVFPNCGHMPIIENPHGVIDAIEGFLVRVKTSRASAATGAQPSAAARDSPRVLEMRTRRRAIPTPDPDVIRRTWQVLQPICDLYFRSEVRYLDRVPDGPTLLVGNHDGGPLPVDGICFGVAWHRHFRFQRPLRVLMHYIPFHIGRRLARWLNDCGMLSADAVNLECALDEGESVLLYPGAAREAFRPYSQRREIDLGGRTGFVIRALRRGIPITPVVSVGAHETHFVLLRGSRLARAMGIYRYFRADAWPLVVGLPWGIWFGPMFLYLPLPSKITVEVLPPIDLREALSQHLGRRITATHADDAEVVRAGFQLVHATMHAAIGRLYDERKYPVIG